jgi:hypothetical protein
MPDMTPNHASGHKPGPVGDDPDLTGDDPDLTGDDPDRFGKALSKFLLPWAPFLPYGRV